MVKTNEELVTNLPLTAEARESMLAQAFAHDLPHIGELYIPGHSFYIHGSSQAQAKHMTRTLCVWLGIKPGYIGLQFESVASEPSAGQRHTIYLERKVLKNELLLGATIAHTLTRYLLEQKKRIFLHDPYEQRSVIATATIVFGLGLIIANGLDDSKASKVSRDELLGIMPDSEYAHMLKGFLKQRNITARTYENHLAPYATRLLGLRRPKKPIPIMRLQYQKRSQKRLEKIGIAWVLLLSICLGIFTVLQNFHSTNSERVALEQKITSLQQQKRECDKKAAYLKQYTDVSDLQAMRTTNAEEFRCKGLGNQLRSAQTELNGLR